LALSAQWGLPVKQVQQEQLEHLERQEQQEHLERQEQQEHLEQQEQQEQQDPEFYQVQLPELIPIVRSA
jgi:hypothetical protein